MRLTESQKQTIENLIDYLKSEVKEDVEPERVAAAMQKYWNSPDRDSARTACVRIQKGAEAMYRVCEDREALGASDFAEYLLDEMTEKMRPEQRKGFFLQCLDTFEQSPKSADETAARAALGEDALKGLLAGKLRQFSQSAASEMESVLRDPYFQEQSACIPVHAAPVKKEDALLFAAAEYMACLEGTLPMEFGMYPELLGTCAASQVVIMQYYDEKGFEENFADIMDCIVFAVIGAAFATSAAAIGVTAAPLLETLAFSSVGVVAGVLIAAALYLAAMLGCMAFVGAVAEAAGLSVEKWNKRRKAERNGSEIFMEQEAERNGTWNGQEAKRNGHGTWGRQETEQDGQEHLYENYQEGMA